jgi:hypothetical protein
MALTNLRSGVNLGQDVRLRTLFTDTSGAPMAPDALPDLYFYDSSVDPALRDADIASATFANASAGPVVPTLLSTGYYEYVYTVPAIGPTGVWSDVWHGVVSGNDVVGFQSFTVRDAVTLTQQQIPGNSMILLELSSNITNAAGTVPLTGTTQLFYLNRLTPLHASPDMIRARVGPWISYLPDDTLVLMIHMSSKAADFLQGAKARNQADLQFAKAQYVICDTALKALSYQGHGQDPATAARNSGGGKKQLGDLSITASSNSASDSIVEVDDYILQDIMECRDEWGRVVNAGGNIVPGESFGITGAQRGKYDPARRGTGRLWEDPRQFHYPQPTVNARGPKDTRNGRMGFYRPGYFRNRLFT